MTYLLQGYTIKLSIINRINIVSTLSLATPTAHSYHPDITVLSSPASAAPTKTAFGPHMFMPILG